MVLNGIRDSIAVKVVGLNVVRRVILGIGSVKVFATVIHASLVGVVGGRSGHPYVLRTVGNSNVNQVTSRGVFEVIVQPVTIIIEEIGTRLVGIRIVLDFIEVIHAVRIAIGDARVREPTKGPEKFLPVGKTITVAVFEVIVTILLGG